MAKPPASPDNRPRCAWPGNELMRLYHDTEWGVPVHDDRKHFEFIVLDSAQAGLSWNSILQRREGYRRAFADFDPVRVGRFSRDRIERLMLDPGIIRNRLKIETTVTNAQLFLKLQEEHGSFDKYIWQFVGGRMIRNRLAPGTPPVATSPESDAMSKALKKLGFKFTGSTICYAYMQAAGMVNDHTTDCFRHAEIDRMGGKRRD